jgi:hypothetical protein
MLESRATYGYYGEGHGATGEKPPKTHASGWSIYTYYFEYSGSPLCKRGINTVEINARSYSNALRRAKAWAKDNGLTIVGDAEGWEYQRNLNS